MNGNGGRVAPAQQLVPAQVLTALQNQSKNRLHSYGDASTKFRAGLRQMQLDAQQVALALQQHPQAIAMLRASFDASSARAVQILQALDFLAQLEIDFQGETQRWLAGMPPSIVTSAPAQQPQAPQQPSAALDPLAQQSGGGGLFAPGQRNAMPQGAQVMPTIQHPVQQVAGVGVPGQIAPQPVQVQPQGGMATQFPTQGGGLPVVQFASPAEANAAANVAHATQAPIAPPPAPPPQAAPNGSTGPSTAS